MRQKGDEAEVSQMGLCTAALDDRLHAAAILPALRQAGFEPASLAQTWPGLFQKSLCHINILTKDTSTRKFHNCMLTAGYLVVPQSITQAALTHPACSATAAQSLQNSTTLCN
jgi:hypothetical protein